MRKLDHNFRTSLSAKAVVGPDVTFVRNSPGVVRTSGLRWESKLPAGAMRFKDATIVRNQLAAPLDLTDVSWSRTGMALPVKDAANHLGNANSAWTLTDTAGASVHAIAAQVSVDPLVVTGAEGNNGYRQIKLKAGTKRYVSIGLETTADVTSPVLACIFDLQDGVVTASNVQDDSGGVGLAQRIHIRQLDNGFWHVGVSGHWFDIEPFGLAIGISNGPSWVDASYTGDGSGTIIVNEPHLFTDASLNESTLQPFTDSYKYTSVKPRPIYGGYNTWQNLVDNGLPELGYYGGNFTELFGDGQRLAVKAPQAVQTPPDPYSYPKKEHKGMRFIVTNGRNVVDIWLYNGGPPPYFQSLTISFYVTDIRVPTNNKIAQLFGWGETNGDLDIYLSDVGPDGRVVRTVDYGDYASQIKFGVGIDGPDTADFTISGFQIEEGSEATAFVANDSYAYNSGAISLIGPPAPVKGLLIERQKTNICQRSLRPLDAPWVRSTALSAPGPYPPGSFPYDGSRNDVPSVFSFEPPNDLTVNLINTRQAFTGLATSTRYSAKVEMDLWISAGWMLFEFLHGAKAIWVWIRGRNFPRIQPGNKNFTIDSVGADVLEARIEQPTGQFGCNVYLTFVTDAVETTGTLVIHSANNKVLSHTGNGLARIAAGYVQLEQGDPTTSIDTLAATAVREADVVTITDMSWFNAPAGTFLAEFHTPDVFDFTTPRTALSVSDGTANERFSIEIDTTGQEIRFIVIDGGVEQCNIVGPVAVRDTDYRVAFSYTANSFNLAVNGTLYTEDTSGTIPTVTKVNIGSDHAGLNQIDSTVGRLYYDDTVFSQSDLIGLSNGRIPASGKGLSRAVGRPIELIRDRNV